MSGSLYAQAFINIADLLTGASKDAAYEAAYGPTYVANMQRANARRARHNTQLNIAAIAQDKIATDSLISLKQTEAEARAKVLAAASGREGGSVDDVKYQIEVNSTVAKQHNARSAEQLIEEQLSNIFMSQSTLIASKDPYVNKPNVGMEAMKAFTGMVGDDDIRGQLAESWDNLFK